MKERFFERILPVFLYVAPAWVAREGTSKNWKPQPAIDALIGATAIAHNLTVVTRNTRDLLATGARILDLWEV